MRQLEPTDRANSAGENRAADGGRRRGNDSLQTDPRVSDSWSAYAYADNNPIGRYDPTGRLSFEWLKDSVLCALGITGATVGTAAVNDPDQPWTSPVDEEGYPNPTPRDDEGRVLDGLAAFAASEYLIYEHCGDLDEDFGWVEDAADWTGEAAEDVVDCVIWGDCGGNPGNTVGCTGPGCPPPHGKPGFGRPASCSEVSSGGHWGFGDSYSPESEIKDPRCYITQDDNGRMDVLAP